MRRRRLTRKTLDSLLVYEHFGFTSVLSRAVLKSPFKITRVTNAGAFLYSCLTVLNVSKSLDTEMYTSFGFCGTRRSVTQVALYGIFTSRRSGGILHDEERAPLVGSS